MGFLGLSRTKKLRALEEELRNSVPGLQRVGIVRLDLVALETRLRQQVPSFRVEEGEDRLFLYADHVLSEGEFNRVQQEFKDVVTIDRS